MEITTLTQAMQLHAQIIKKGKGDDTLSLSNLFTFSALSNSGSLTYARQIFNSLPHPNSYFWNTMIRAYATSTEPEQALHLFLSMQHKDHNPDKFTYPFLLKSCGCLRYTRLGKQFHALVYKAGLQCDRFIQNSLIHMYCSCGESDSATWVFDQMRYKDVVTWTTIIDGYVDGNRSAEALELFRRMQEQGVECNHATVVSVLRACAEAGALGIGREVHQIVKRKMFESVKVGTALIDMYSKCGCIDSARGVFDAMRHKDAYAWTAMIAGLASHGQSQNAIQLFEEMSVQPDVRTITAVLSACRNAGWVRLGYSYFNKLEKRFGIRPTLQHYGCMVDLLARVGHLKEAELFIQRMPIEPDSVVWRNLIWACQFHGDNDRAERLIHQQQLLQTDPNDIGTYVLCENVYASAGKWSEKATVREMMTGTGLAKPKGSSKVDIEGTIHEFAAGDTSHPDAVKIYGKLDEITEKLELEGYQPKVSEVMLDIGDEEKAFQLHHHSEKLAVAFALINTNTDGRIQIIKNLRSCEDCHSVMKYISKLYEREIVIRDRIRFHHFKNGNCSCGDYW